MNFITYRKNILYIGFSTIYSFRNPLGIYKHDPCGWGGTTHKDIYRTEGQSTKTPKEKWQNTLKAKSQEGLKMIAKYIKICSHSLIITEMQMKNWDTISHLSDWQKLKTKIIHCFIKIMGNRESHMSLVGIQIGVPFGGKFDNNKQKFTAQYLYFTSRTIP